MDAKLKYLEMLQAAISRMSGFSFVAKGWSVTLATAVMGFMVKDGGPKFALIGVVVIALFWLIDAYYLGLEKEFRTLFSAAVATPANPTFNMKPEMGRCAMMRAAFRPALLMVHLPLLIALAFSWYFLQKSA